jgi:hypothetical protein
MSSQTDESNVVREYYVRSYRGKRRRSETLLKDLSVHYVGQQFPALAQDQTGDVAIIRILDEELGEEWQAGFYCFDSNIMRVEEAIQASTAKLSSADAGVGLTRRTQPITTACDPGPLPP